MVFIFHRLSYVLPLPHPVYPQCARDHQYLRLSDHDSADWMDMTHAHASIWYPSHRQHHSDDSPRYVKIRKFTHSDALSTYHYIFRNSLKIFLYRCWWWGFWCRHLWDRRNVSSDMYSRKFTSRNFSLHDESYNLYQYDHPSLSSLTSHSPMRCMVFTFWVFHELHLRRSAHHVAQGNIKSFHWSIFHNLEFHIQVVIVKLFVWS